MEKLELIELLKTFVSNSENTIRSEYARAEKIKEDDFEPELWLYDFHKGRAKGIESSLAKIKEIIRQAT